MTMNAKRRRVHDKLAKLPGVRPVRRPVSPGSDDEFDLYYVRTGRKSAHPLVIIPGGPGVASMRLYQGLRRRAAAAGLDVIMIEHRGVGMSRHDDSGADLPPEALTIDQVVDDVAAVLDDAHVDSAVVYGTSYGTYIAAGLGVRHPGRVEAMILDSPVLSRHDIALARDAIRRLLLKGDSPETAALAPKVRRLVDSGVMTPSAAQVAAAIYGYGGAKLLGRQLDLLLDGRTMLWRGLCRVTSAVNRKVPYRYENDLVSRIAFRELDYAAEPDGLPLDPAVAMRETLKATAAFESEPYDLVAEMPKFGWPTVVVSGGRDLITPPTVAERVASLVPDAVLVELPTMAHSALDFREPAALAIAAAVCRGEHHRLTGQAPLLDDMPARAPVRLLWKAIDMAAAAEAAVLPVRRQVSPA
ncbi:MAG: alpha/beta hydrolase [Mycobacterium pseudokansasii]|uniref:Rhodomycin D methylesterase DauP n=1 Tax=Mycobacterium pseudokansasii TaxID=2341080 RepID=A0A498R0Y6_9MYCO|nr:alpha/beta fold hydrolase [Mycobacterium pseudokansasii]KZS70573.1 alpha/beta hydrolase [Mycobacterium kansasii]MBY0389037.1 alpha/beta hydrolase [Mycobacterium pseudokansasii]VAZ99112.1 Rhodomycin D methylesterase DauP [Mycobacterium pseudokansasii]VBA30279.1 Rhodomycin D methylesterase DauP [Mycobacterium pseudokansasii]VBA53513.1 Rhodomycin D methylesterase DauP [Mycobacterium pseudokansasii]